jgi:hypothetical protein
MPSDEGVQREQGVRRALDALAGRRAEFRAAVETAYAQARAFLAAHGPRSDERARETALELGPFAGGRVDAARFAALVTAARVLSPEEETVLRRCAEVMDEVLARGDGLFVCDVPAGGSLRAAVEATLAEAGRAFGAALVFQAVKSGSYRAEEHAAALRAFPYCRWNRGERLLAPPLVVSVDGGDLHAGALAEYLDGRQKILVVARGAVTPVPLARLVAPRTYVAQVSDASASDPCATDVEALARVVAFDGPAVVAFVPESAARFVHDPGAGATLAKRLRVVALPKERARAAVGGHSVAQQREELAHLVELTELAALAATPSPVAHQAAAATVVAAGAADDGAAVSALTSWLLAQAGLPSSNGAPATPGGARP